MSLNSTLPPKKNMQLGTNLSLKWPNHARKTFKNQIENFKRNSIL